MTGPIPKRETITSMCALLACANDIAAPKNGKPMHFKQAYCHDCHSPWEVQNDLAHPVEQVRIKNQPSNSFLKMAAHIRTLWPISFCIPAHHTA